MKNKRATDEIKIRKKLVRGKIMRELNRGTLLSCDLFPKPFRILTNNGINQKSKIEKMDFPRAETFIPLVNRPLLIVKKTGKFKPTDEDKGNYMSPFKDTFKTPEEIIFNCLKPDEIRVIMADPGFFKAQKEIFKGVVAFENISLKQRIELEENFKTTDGQIEYYRMKAKKSFLRSCRDVVKQMRKDYDEIKNKKLHFDGKFAGLEQFIEDQKEDYELFKRYFLKGNELRRKALQPESNISYRMKGEEPNLGQKVSLSFPKVAVTLRKEKNFSQQHNKRRAQSIDFRNNWVNNQ